MTAVHIFNVILQTENLSLLK